MLKIGFSMNNYAAFKSLVALLGSNGHIFWSDIGGGYPTVRAVFPSVGVIVSITPSIPSKILVKDFPNALKVDTVEQDG